VDILVPGDWSVPRAHALADVIEKAVQVQTGARLTTNIEPTHPRSAE